MECKGKFVKLIVPGDHGGPWCTSHFWNNTCNEFVQIKTTLKNFWFSCICLACISKPKQHKNFFVRIYSQECILHYTVQEI